MWTQTWPIANIQQLDREGRKIIVENGGNLPKGSTAILYMSRKLGGRGLKSVENEYKNTKIKSAVKLYCNADVTMAAVRSFEELTVQNGRHSIMKDAKKYAAEELDLQLWLKFPNPVAVADGKEVEAKKVQQAIFKARQQEIQSTVSKKRWQGKLIKNRWDEKEVKMDEFFCVASFMEECPNAYHRLRTRALPTTVTYQGLLQEKNKITSH